MDWSVGIGYLGLFGFAKHDAAINLGDRQGGGQGFEGDLLGAIAIVAKLPVQVIQLPKMSDEGFILPHQQIFRKLKN